MTPRKNLDNDPEIQAQKKKNRLTQLRVEGVLIRVQATYNVTKIFRAELLSVISGIAAAWVGIAQIRKRYWQDKKDITSLQVEVQETSKKHHKSSSKPEAQSPTIELSGGSFTVSPGSSGMTVSSVTTPPNVFLGRSAKILSPLTDPMSWVAVALVVVFVFTSFKAWRSLKNKLEKFSKAEK